MNNEQVKKQKIKYKQPLFQYEIYPVKSRTSYLPENPWHWHTEFEICYVISGSVKYKTPGKEYTLKAGDVLFVNADVIHSVIPVNPSDDLYFSVHFIDELFVSGGRGNAFDVKYVFPIKNNDSIEMVLFDGSNPRTEVVRSLIEENIQLKRKKEKFWEFRIKNNINLFWEFIVNETEQINTEINLVTVRDETLKAALTFIQEHYDEKINLEQISSFAHISTRECNRKFMKHLKITPMNYLCMVRLQKASQMLQDFNKSIGYIALENGFSGASYFTKVFKEYYNITPIEYRNSLKYR